MITISAAILYIATKCLDQFIKEEGYSRIRLFFFPKDKYINRLRDLIMKVLDEFALTDLIKYREISKIPFYHSPEVFQTLIDHVLFKELDVNAVQRELQANGNVHPPTGDEIKRFFDLFSTKVNADKKLKKIFIEENYKSQIFELSNSLNKMDLKIDGVAKSIASLDAKFDSIHVDEYPVITSDYITSPEEEKLREVLLNKDVLLMTGVSFCGKSQLAKTIADQFVKDGYKYHGGSDVDEAGRFIRNRNGNHICLLEDPFGHNFESESKLNLRKVEELLRNIAPGNKLIITSRSEVLTSTKGSDDVASSSLDGHNWNELSERGRQFLSNVWDKLSAKLPNTCKELINKHLETASDKELLQVGQLAHLSRLPNETLDGKTLDTLIHLAKADSKSLSVDIKSRGVLSHQLYLVLGLSSSTTQGVSFGTLSYLLSKVETYPGLLKKEALRARDPKSASEISFPTYDEQYSLSDEVKAEITFFVDRGYLQISNDMVFFRHPTYQQAARYLIVETNTLDTVFTLEKIKRTIGCLSQKNAAFLSSQLLSMSKEIQNKELKDGILKFAYENATRSIFPSVRDWLLKFLLDNLPEVDDRMQEGIFHLIDADMSSSDIFWHDDQPFYSKFDRDWFDEEEFDENVLTSVMNELNSNGNVSTYNIWAIVLIISKPDFPLTDFPDEKVIDRILNAEETFIRSKMAFALLNRLPFTDDKILTGVFSDTNPSVVLEAIRGALYAYPFYSSEQRQKIVPMLEEAVSNDFVIARVRTLLTCFGIDYGLDHIDWDRIDEKNKPAMWELWAKIFPIFMERMPISVSIYNSGRFGQTMNAAVDFLKNTVAGLRVAHAYYHWVDARISSGIIPDTHELGVVSFLLEISDDHDARLPLFRKMLQHPKTSLTLYSLSWAMSDWNDLSDAEKEVIIELCSSERLDKRWIVATALTRQQQPAEIQGLLLEKVDLFDLTAAEIVAHLSPATLSDALEVYIGENYLIGHLGISHSRSDKWHEIHEYILRKCHQPDFTFCLNEFVIHVINGPASNWRDSYLSIWEEMCANESLRNTLTEQLILGTARSNPSIPSCTDLWKELIKVHPGSLKMELAGKIADAVEAIQRYDASDIFEFFDQELLNIIVEHCPLDRAILSSLIKNKGNSLIPAEDIDALADEVILLSESHHVKLELTFDYIKGSKARAGGHPRYSELERLPDLIYEKGGQWIEAKRTNREISNWIA